MNLELNLTAIVLTYNEERRIKRCVQSLENFSHLIVLDSYSTDATLQLARESWVALGRAPETFLSLARTWQGFTEARNYSQRWVTTDWCLWIDADEWIEEDLKSELKLLDWSNLKKDVFRIPRKSIYMGHWVRFGGWYPDKKRRLARTQAVEWRGGPRGADVHEDLWPLKNISLSLGTLKGHLGHEPFLSYKEHRETNERYSMLLAEGLAREYTARERRIPSQIYICFKVFVKFIENWIWKLGILDGKVGCLIALGSAQSLYWRLTKAKNLFKSSVGNRE